METDYNQFKGLSEAELEKLEHEVIKVRASISCPGCNYSRQFRNNFQLRNLEQMVVSLKVFDWLTCPMPSCGELLNLNLEFEL